MRNTKEPELVILMNAIALSCKQIATAVKRAGIAKLYGLAGEQNSTGDDQKMLDVMSNEIMINALRNSGVCSVLVSEEDEDPIIVPEADNGKYCVAFDPLDGSSNIDCNVSVGTIFGVYEKVREEEGGKEEERSKRFCKHRITSRTHSTANNLLRSSLPTPPPSPSPPHRKLGRRARPLTSCAPETT